MKNKATPNRMPNLQMVKQEIDNGDDDEDEVKYEVKYEYEDHNGFPMEPMTILEELESKQPTISNVESYAVNGHNQVSRSQDPLDDEEDDEIEESYAELEESRRSRPKDVQKELLSHEIKLRELQRQNEEEKMEFEREIFRKRSALLDLKMRKITLELEVLEGNRSKSSGFNHNTDDDEN